MMDWTDRHCRYFMRLLSPSVFLYTEMVTAAALKHGDTKRLLRFDGSEHPIALQIGGSEPRLMAAAAKLGADEGYDEININVGCPSDRVQSGQFGACLMSQPTLVADCVSAMQSVVDIPVTIKTRIGIDDHDDYDFLRKFIDANVEVGCNTFIVHARKAILAGLSPKDNRTVPPLNYDRVYRLKQDMPELKIILNGGISPWFLTELEQEFGGGNAISSRHEAVRQMLPYIEREMAEGAALKHITRHMLGLFAGLPGARAWRRYLSENAHRSGGGIEVLEMALEKLPHAA